MPNLNKLNSNPTQDSRSAHTMGLPALLWLCLTLPCHATVIFFDGPEWRARATTTIPAGIHDRLQESEYYFHPPASDYVTEQYTFLSTDGTGKGRLLFSAYVDGYGGHFDGDNENLEKYTTVGAPFQLWPVVAPWLDWAPNSCEWQTCPSIEFTYGEPITFTVGVGAEIEYWYRRHLGTSDEQAIIGEVTSEAWLKIVGMEDMPDTPIHTPEPATAVLSIAGLLLASLSPTCRRIGRLARNPDRPACPRSVAVNGASETTKPGGEEPMPVLEHRRNTDKKISEAYLLGLPEDETSIAARLAHASRKTAHIAASQATSSVGSCLIEELCASAPLIENFEMRDHVDQGQHRWLSSVGC